MCIRSQPPARQRGFHYAHAAVKTDTKQNIFTHALTLRKHRGMLTNTHTTMLRHNAYSHTHYADEQNNVCNFI